MTKSLDFRGDKVIVGRDNLRKVNLRTEKKIDLRRIPAVFTFKIYMARFIWGIVYLILFRFSPRFFFGWRRFLLRMFGAKIDRNVHVYPSVCIDMPWRLSISENSVMGPNVICYNIGGISVGKNVIISQNSHLCSASHDYTSRLYETIFAPIHIDDNSWICADVFIAPGVNIGEGVVVGARSVVTHDVKPWTIVAGNPAKYIKNREIRL